MEKGNFLRTIIAITKAKAFKRRFPLTVSWALTYRCNQKCLYCRLNEISANELETEQIFRIIDELKKLGVCWISFTGGEPLLRDDIGVIVSYAWEKNITTGINSNGILVKDKIKEIKRINRLQLSLDGSKEIHDKVRGEGSYEKAIDAIWIAKEFGISVVLNCTITKYNTNFIEEILNIAEKNKVKVIFQPTYNHILGTWWPNPLMAAIEEYKECIRYLILEKRNRRDCIVNSISGLKHLLNWPFSKEIRCYAGRLDCRIEPNGSVYPCKRNPDDIFSLKSPRIKFEEQFYNLSVQNCKYCWCGAQIEYNLSLSFNMDALFNMMHLIFNF